MTELKEDWILGSRTHQAREFFKIIVKYILKNHVMEIFFLNTVLQPILLFFNFSTEQSCKILFNIHLDINSMFNIDSKINVYSKKESLFQLDKAFFFWEGGGAEKGGRGCG